MTEAALLADLEGTHPETWIDLQFCQGGNATEFVSEGWAGPNETFTWTLGYQSSISVPTPKEQRNFRLTIRALPFIVPKHVEHQRLVVMINQRFAGYFVLSSPDEQTLILDLPWQMLSGRIVTTFAFQMPDATSPAEAGLSGDTQTLGVAFAALTICDQSSYLPNNAVFPILDLPIDLRQTLERQKTSNALFRKFESLGYDCEFGLVQQAYDIHALGLLRFAAVSADAVADLLEGGLDRVGARENITTEISADSEMYVVDRTCGLRMHSFNVVDKGLTESALIEREAKRLPRIARKLREDIETGDKIFIFLDPVESHSAVERMVAALRKAGPNELLWIRKPSSDYPAGSVVRARPGLLLGFLSGRYERAKGSGFGEPDLEVWTAVCERALTLCSERR